MALMMSHHNAAISESKSSDAVGSLYIVATPIGNLKDITLRALDILQHVDVIACEDTRVSRKLLRHYAIETRLVSYHEHNAAQARPKLLQQLADGVSIALISDAGTPLICDPGFKLVLEAQEAGVAVIPIPGANAAISALSACGLPTDRFAFAGFLPTKAAARATMLSSLASFDGTLVFYESAKRLLTSLSAIQATLGEREVVVARELTKQHEEIVRAPIQSLIDHLSARDSIKGEVVLVIGPPAARMVSDEALDALIQFALGSMSTKEAAAWVAEQTGLSKSDCYQRILSSRS